MAQGSPRHRAGLFCSSCHAEHVEIPGKCNRREEQMTVGWGTQGNAAILLRARDSSSSTLASRFLWASQEPQKIGGECDAVLGSHPGLSNPAEPQICNLRIQFGIQTQLLIDVEKRATAEVSSSHPRCEFCGGVSPPLLTAVGALGFQLSLC